MFCVKIKKSDFKSAARWAEITAALELPEGRDEVIVMRIPGLLPVKEGWKIEQQIKLPEEWMIGESVKGKRQWIVHTFEPRFIAEIFDDDSEDMGIGGLQYQMRNCQWLCNFLWLDPPPEDLTSLLQEAEDAIEIYDYYLNGEQDD